MRRVVRCLDLGDASLERLVVGAGFGELIVHSQRELPVTLLQIELRHRLIDEWLRAGTGEHAVLFP